MPAPKPPQLAEPSLMSTQSLSVPPPAPE